MRTFYWVFAVINLYFFIDNIWLDRVNFMTYLSGIMGMICLATAYYWREDRNRDN